MIPAAEPGAMVSPEELNSSWYFDSLIGDFPVQGDLASLEEGFQWAPNALADSNDLSAGFVDSFGNSDGSKGHGSRKRMNTGSSSDPDSKACREKKRRDMLNDRFQELNAILEPGRPPKMDKATVLSDAIRTVTQLREESSKLKESCEDLQQKISELKAEKNELRDEKQKLKAEKERMELQLKALSTPPAFLPPPVPFPAPGQVVGNKFVPFMGYHGVPMWQFTPPAAVDTSQDHVLRPPVA